MNKRHIIAHMKSAFNYSELSYAKRRKVGCVIVKNNNIIAIGYNGTPEGWDNCCEDENNKTLPDVIHAEANAIGKLAEGTGGGKGSSVFITAAPCLSCAMQLANARVKEVYYAEVYRNITEGLEHLHKRGIQTYHLDILNKQE